MLDSIEGITTGHRFPEAVALGRLKELGAAVMTYRGDEQPAGGLLVLGPGAEGVDVQSLPEPLALIIARVEHPESFLDVARSFGGARYGLALKARVELADVMEGREDAQPLALRQIKIIEPCETRDALAEERSVEQRLTARGDISTMIDERVPVDHCAIGILVELSPVVGRCSLHLFSPDREVMCQRSTRTSPMAQSAIAAFASSLEIESDKGWYHPQRRSNHKSKPTTSGSGATIIGVITEANVGGMMEWDDV